jgi:hypothetical protein
VNLNNLQRISCDEEIVHMDEKSFIPDDEDEPSHSFRRLVPPEVEPPEVEP